METPLKEKDSSAITCKFNVIEIVNLPFVIDVIYSGFSALLTMLTPRSDVSCELPRSAILTMYTLEIDFKTENEDVRLIKDKFTDAFEAAAFAVDFVTPYIMKYEVANGEWRVYKTDNPDIIERYCKIESLLSLKAKEAASGL